MNRRLYIVVELFPAVGLKYAAWRYWDHEPSSGINWVCRGMPSSYRRIRARVARLNRLAA